MRSLTQEDLLFILLKRKWWILASVVVCVPLAYGAWKWSPKSFRSTVVVTIDSPKVAKDYVKGLGGTEGRGFDDPAAVAMQQIMHALTNRSVLLPIIEKVKPYPGSGDEAVGPLMNRLRREITLSKTKDGIGIVISYAHPDPMVAQGVMALLPVTLQEDNTKRREGLIETTSKFLSSELERVKGELEAKERAMSEFKKAHTGELPGQLDANLRTLDRLQTDLTITAEFLKKEEERLAALDKTIKEFSDTRPRDVVSVERGSRRRVISRPPDPRDVKLEGLRQKLDELLGMYKENYPDVVLLREEIHRLELEPRLVDSGPPVMDEQADGVSVSGDRPVHKAVDPFLRELMKERNEVKNEMDRLKEKQTNTVRQIKEIEVRVAHTPMTEQGLATLVRDYENQQKGYQSLLDKRTNARILENYETRQFGEQYRIIEPASFPSSPEPPTLMQYLLYGFGGGCALGFGVVVGLEFLKPGFRRPEEVESYLGLPVIASIPPFDPRMVQLSGMRPRVLLTGPKTDVGNSERPPAYSAYGEGRKWRGSRFRKQGIPLTSVSLNSHLITKWAPDSIMAEQYRVASTRLLLMTAEKQNVVTLVASSMMGEGKTTTAINLAYVLAHDLKKSTLLIDCDFKRPMVHEYVDISVKPGLSEAMQGGDTLENCIHPYAGIPLSILPCGDPKTRPASITGIQYVKQILSELRIRYDHVILDGPPVLTLADVNILNSMADHVIFVVRAGLTSQEMVRTAVKQLNAHGDGIGVVLTQVEMEFAPYLMYHKDYAAKNY